MRKGEDEKHQVFWFLFIVCYFFAISLALAYEESTSGWAFIIGAVVAAALGTLLCYVHTEEWKSAADMSLRAFLACLFFSVALLVLIQFRFDEWKIFSLAVLIVVYNALIVFAPHSPGGQKKGLMRLYGILFKRTRQCASLCPHRRFCRGLLLLPISSRTRRVGGMAATKSTVLRTRRSALQQKRISEYQASANAITRPLDRCANVARHGRACPGHPRTA